MKKLLVIGVLLLSAQAMAQNGKELAQESMKTIESLETMLPAALTSTKADLDRFIIKPARDQALKWPAMGNPAVDKYRRCEFALQDFQIWAQDQYRAGGKLPKDSPSAKAYSDSKKQCKSSLK